eukprot:gene4122-4518_t
MTTISNYLNTELRIPLWSLGLGVGVYLLVHQLTTSYRNPSRGKTNITSTPPPPAAPAAAAVQPESPKPTADSDDEDSDDDDDELDGDYLFYDEPYPIINSYDSSDGPFKMLLIVNNELKMGKGKIAAQCGHATLGAYRIARKYCKTGLERWCRHGTAKVVVRVDQESEMYEIYEKAKLIGLVGYIVMDAGRTQIAAGSRTVLALGPAPVSMIDQIASHLKLL